MRFVPASTAISERNPLVAVMDARRRAMQPRRANYLSIHPGVYFYDGCKTAKKSKPALISSDWLDNSEYLDALTVMRQLFTWL